MIAKYRDGLVPLLSKQETTQSITHSVMRMRTRRTLESKLGKTIYVMAFYEKVKRLAMPIGKAGEYTLVASFDINAEHDAIVRKQIIPIVEPYTSISDEYKI